MALPSVRALTLTPFYLSVLLNDRITMMRRRSSSRSRRRITLIIMIVSVLLSLSDCVLFVWCPGAMVWRRSVGFCSRRVAYHLLLCLAMVVLATQMRYKCHVAVACHSPSSTLALVRILLPLFPIRTTNQPSTTATDPITLARISPASPHSFSGSHV